MNKWTLHNPRKENHVAIHDLYCNGSVDMEGVGYLVAFNRVLAVGNDEDTYYEGEMNPNHQPQTVGSLRTQETMLATRA